MSAVTSADAQPAAVAPKVYPPPPFPLLHKHINVDQFMTPFPAGPWSVNVNAPAVPKGSSDYQTLSAYVRGSFVKVWYKIASPSFPKGFYFGLEASKSADAKPVVNPTVNYKFEKNGENIVGFAPVTGRVSHTWSHDKGTFTTDLNTNLYDYLNTDGCLNSRLYPGLLGGFDFEFDPTRSGLKSYRFGLKYKMTHAVSYDGTGTVAVSTQRSFLPGRLHGCTHLKAGRKGYEATVGLQAFSPCGAKVSTKLQVHDGTAAVGLSRIIGGNWRVNVGVHGNVYKKAYNGVGVSFNYDQ